MKAELNTERQQQKVDEQQFNNSINNKTERKCTRPKKKEKKGKESETMGIFWKWKRKIAHEIDQTIELRPCCGR